MESLTTEIFLSILAAVLGSLGFGVRYMLGKIQEIVPKTEIQEMIHETEVRSNIYLEAVDNRLSRIERLLEYMIYNKDSHVSPD